MKTIEFLSYLYRLDVKLWADGDRLRYQAPQGVMTAPLRTELAERKAEILMFLRQVDAVTYDTVPLLQPVARDRPLPLSFAQQRLWFLDQLEPNSPTYNVPNAIRLTGVLDLVALRQSLNAIMRRHEILRTTFASPNGQPVQVIAPIYVALLSLIDLRALSADKRQAVTLGLTTKEARQPFDLAHGPLLRATLLRLDEHAHVMLLTMHHIVSDGWSMEVLVREMGILYSAFVAGQPSPLPKLPIQYADYAVWQREWLQGAALEAQMAYWQQQLADLPVLELPINHPRPSVATFRGERQSFVLLPALSAGLRSLSQQEGVTLFMTLLGAFQVLLARYSGQDDIVVGTPIANRHRAETEGLIGLFLNMLALRLRLSSHPSFREVLRRVRVMCLGAYAHQNLPFEQVVDMLQPARDLSRHPLFQVMFTLEHASTPDMESSSLALQSMEIENTTTKFDLTLSMMEGAYELKGALEYRTDLFDPTTIERMLAHFQVLLEGIVAHPAQHFAELPLLPDAERRQLLVDWNTTQATYSDVCVHDLFEAQVARTPDSVAVVCADQHLSYAALDARASRLAHLLRARGVAPDVPVALCLPRAPVFLIALLAVLKAGGAFLPLDPHAPPQRLAFLLRDSAAPLLLSLSTLRPALPTTLPPLLCLDLPLPPTPPPAACPPRAALSPAHLAYILYTSGSTGSPKGVMVSHRALVNYLLWAAHFYPHASDAGALLHSPLTFDLSLTALFVPLLLGLPLLLLPDDADLEALSAALQASSALSLLKLTPTHLALLGPQLPPAVARIRSLILGGEALHGALLAAWRQAAPASALFNEYGPTETVVGCCVYRLPPELALPQAVPIGRPIANTLLYLLDPHMQPVPVGVAGELFVGGDGLARGYLRRPDLTAERFLPNPFAQVVGDGCWVTGAASSNTQHPSPNTRLYRTGDYARYRADGVLDYLGRRDEQVKLRGFRIELGEIETVLRAHPLVRQAAVALASGPSGQPTLVAYLVPRAAALTEQSLQQFVQAQLPAYMRPTSYVLLAALPLNPSGKLDRRALPPSAERLLTDPADRPAPRTPIEALLAQIWASVLGRQPIGVQDNFFALGGDSILSLQIIARARQAGVQLTPKQLFQYPTIAQLAALAGSSAPVLAPQGRIGGPVPLTPIQCWFFAQELPNPQHYNQALLFTLRQPLLPTLLAQALRALLAHHDALRLRFVRTETGWQQLHADREETRLGCWFDLSGLAGPAQRAALEETAAALQRSLDLRHGPLLRVALFTLGQQQGARLLLLGHHLVVDGVTWRILLEDLQSAYVQLVQGQVLALPPKTTSFQQWAERLQSYAGSAALRAAAAYWLAAGRTTVGRLPRERADGANTQATARMVEVGLSVAETEALLREVPAVYHTQISEVLLTALAQVVGAWTGEAALLVELEGHGREELFAEVDLTRTVGWFTTLYPVLLDLSGVVGAGAALKAIKEQVRAVPQRGLGYGVLRYLGAEDEVSAVVRALPEAEVSFNYLGQVDQLLAPEGLFGPARESSGPSQHPAGRRSHLLEVNGLVAGGRLRLAWTYSAAIHQRATIERLAQRYLAALRALIAHCQTPQAGGFSPSDFPLAALDQSSLDHLLGADRQVEALYPLAPLQHGLLFHALQAPHSGVYVAQLSCTLHGELHVACFKQAWQQVLARHPSLRTAFVGLQLPTPLQLVRPQVAPPWERADWQAAPEAQQRARLSAYREQVRTHGLDLATAPLLRLALFQLAPQRYAFVWTWHHLVLDGWSVTLVLNEVFACYSAARQGQALQLAAARPYQDYIAWLQQRDLASAEAFWRQQLHDLTAPTTLDIDRPAAHESNIAKRRGEQHREVAAATSAALHALARAQALTLNTLVLGAWALLLSRYSGQEDVVFGVTVAGRPPELAGMETMVGLFINTLPLRVRLDGGARLDGWLGQLQAQQVELRQYEDSPLVAVQGWSGVPRTQPLFESIVVFENYPVAAAVATPSAPAHLTIADVWTFEQDNYPLTLLAGPGSVVRIVISYDGALFAGGAIARMLGHLEQLLAQMVAAPEQPLAALTLLSAAERVQLLSAWNATTQAYPHTQSAPALVAAQAAQRPDAVALAADTAHLTYHALCTRANQLAYYLRTRDVGPEVCVGICMERSLELIVGLLGILTAGAAYVPLDPAYPRERIQYMLEDSGTQVLLTQKSIYDVRFTIYDLEESAIVNRKSKIVNPQVVCLDRDWTAIAQQSVTAPPCAVRPANLAYLIYTSGSTGTPKGVQISHQNLIHSTWARLTYYRDPVTSFLLLASIAFDSSVAGIFWTLCQGGRLVLPPGSLSREVSRIADVIAQQHVSHVTSLPSLYALMLAQVPSQQLASLRTVIVAGESCPDTLIQQHQEVLPQTSLFNEYGPTEGTVWSTVYDCRTPWLGAVVPIGRPIANMRIYLLDRQAQPVPIGIAGELYIGGAGLARGYHNRPDLTAERFVPNPFQKDEGKRMKDESMAFILHPSSFILYKTGDRARYLSDGNLVFLGRIDQQVKVRGYRIELEEIEALLSEHPAVRECVVIAREDTPGDTRLMAYVVQGSGVRGQGATTPLPPPAGGGTEGGAETRRQGDKETGDDAAVTQNSKLKTQNYPPPQSPIPNPQSLIPELRAFLKERLPDHMIPAAIMLLGALPLTPNGKVDRRALPALDTTRSSLNTAFVAPRTPAEELVAGIWADVLRLEQVGIYDNFFALGGHSLLAIQIISRMYEAFQVEVPMRDLFEAPTVAELAERITTARHGASGLQAPPLRPVPRDEVLPLSFAQQRLWFLDQLQPNSPAYIIATAVRITGALAVAAMQQSLSAIMRRHEALRTSFPMRDGQPVQAIAAPRPLPLPLIDLHALPADERTMATQRVAAAEAQRSFDLACGPLLRATLVRLSDAEHVVLLTMHHSISDAWSMEVLIREVTTLYGAFSTRQPASLPELPIQYADYAVWQRGWLQSTMLEAQLAYWRQQLAELPELRLPTNHPRPPIPTFEGTSQNFVLPPAVSKELAALSRREGVTLFMAMLAAWQVLLARYSGQSDIAVGTPIANRQRAETEHLIGCFLNTLVLRTDLSGNPSFRDVLRRVREVCLGAYAHQDLPFEQVVDVLQPARDLSRHPLFQVLFVLQHAPQASVTLPDLGLRTLDMQRSTAQFDLSLFLQETEEGLAGALEYRTDLFDRATIDRMLGHLETLLEGIVADPDQHFADLPLLAEAERQQLIGEWNATTAAYPHDQCIHQLFEAQAARTPDAVALVFEGPTTIDQRPTTNDQRPKIEDGRSKIEDRRSPAFHPRSSILDPQSSVLSPQSLTYSELNAHADRLAQYLRSSGVGPEICVGICMERSLELVVGIMGILKAGGAYVPLDPAYPSERLVAMLADSRAPVLLTQQHIYDLRFTIYDLPRDDQPLELKTQHSTFKTPVVVCLNTLQAHNAPPVVQNLDATASAENLVYVIYTSGSTGTPKGVMARHQGLVNFAFALADRIGLWPGQHMLQFASFSFDASALQVFPTLISGATLLLHQDPGRLSNHELLTLCIQHQITILDLPAAFWQQWIEDLAARNARLPASVRVCMTGGEQIPIERLLTWAGLATHPVRFFSSYGPTEATVTTTLFETTSAQVACLKALNIPLGYRLANIQVYLLDAHLHPVPIGVAGEVYIGGAGLVRGYLHRPDLTAERFIPNPFAQGMGDGGWGMGNESSIPHPPSPIPRLYKTGDLAHYRPDGDIVFMGRIDQQVKLRGFRVEPDEVAAVLRRHPAVREVVVLARQDVPGDKRLVAYVVTTNDQRPTTNDQHLPGGDSDSVLSPQSSVLGHELRSFLHITLPDYMVPSAVVLLEALPLTRNGKVDHRALPIPDRATARRQQSYIPPRDAVELQLAQIWEDLLAVRPISVGDNFFDLGGHSLLAIGLMAHIQQRFGQDLSLATLFQGPTIEQLAARLRQHTASLPWSPVVPIQPGDAKLPFFCVHPVGGNVLCYTALAQHLGLDQPFYGLQARGLEEGQVPFTRIEDMAAHYIEALRETQPEGPYRLGGWSTGGIVAFEMAQQLQRQGQEVALLALLDTGAPQPDHPGDPLTDAEVIVNILGRKNLPMPEDAFRRLDLDEQVKCLLEVAKQFNVLPLDTRPQHIHRSLHVIKASMLAAEGYVPQIYPSRITLFKSESSVEDERQSAATPGADTPDPTMCWGELSTQPVEIHLVPGTHQTMVGEPHVHILAERLRSCLDAPQ